MEKHSSEILLNRLEAGSNTAIPDLENRYLSRIIGLAKSRMSSWMRQKLDPEDIAQETFIAFLDVIEARETSWEKEGDLWRLLATITINQVLRKVEYFTVQKRNIKTETTLDCANELEDANWVSEELNELILSILAKEKPLAQRVITARLAGFTIQETAEQVGRNERTVRRILDSLKSKMFVDYDLFAAREFFNSAPNSANRDPHLRLGSYQDLKLLRMIGQGSFAKVYLARHKTTGELFAVKAIRKKWLASAAAWGSFRQEIEALQKLKIPTFVNLNGFGRLPNGGCFLVLEYIKGKTLTEAAKTATKSQKQMWLQSVKSAIQQLHQNGLSHGDLRSENILIDANNEIRIIDFGLSSFVESNQNSQTQDLLMLNCLARECLR